MTARLIPFLRRKVVANDPIRIDWTQGELAEFYRVEASLVAAGMRVETDRGLTDENDPWFVFCHADGEQDVIIHFARLGGSYLVSTPGLGAGLGGSETGGDFRLLVRRLLAQYETIAAHRRAGSAGAGREKGNVVLHPAAMLWVLIAVAFLKSAEARAFEGAGAAPTAHPPAPAGGDTPGSQGPGSQGSGSQQAGSQQAGSQAGEWQAARDGMTDPLAVMAGYALQSVMIAWATTLGPLAADAHTASRSDALEAWLGKAPVFALAASAALTAALPAAGDASHAPVYTADPGPAGAGSTAEAVAGPVPTAWHGAEPLSHAADQPAGDAALETAAVAHAAPEPPPLLVPDGGANDAPAPQLAQEVLQVLAAAAGGVDIIKDVSVLPALPDTIAAVLDHAIHISEASLEAAFQQASATSSVASTLASAGATPDAGTVAQTGAAAATTAAAIPAITDAATTNATTNATTGGAASDPHAAAGTSDAHDAGMAATGDHATDGSQTAAVQSTAVQADAPQTGASQTGASQTGASSADAPPAAAPLATPSSIADAATAHPAAAAAVVPVPESTTSAALPAAPLPATLDQQELALATSAVHAFLTEVAQAREILVQNTLVVYDAAVTNVAQEQALTFDFSDGSHISLVGLPSEIAHALAGHA